MSINLTPENSSKLKAMKKAKKGMEKRTRRNKIKIKCHKGI